jgi:hypothetical protein
MRYVYEDNDEGLTVVNALNKAIESLKNYPEARQAYVTSENHIIAESNWRPDMLKSLLIALRMQKELLEKLSSDQYTEKAFEEAENVAVEAASTIVDIVKSNPDELNNFLKAQEKFISSYKVMAESASHYIPVVLEFINAEIAILEKEVCIAAITKSHTTIINALQAAIPVLQKYPEALKAFTKAENAFLSVRHSNEWGRTLLKSHILLLKAHRAILHVLDYNASEAAYKEYAASAMTIIEERRELYGKLRNSPGKRKLAYSVKSLTKNFTEFLKNPTINMPKYQHYLDNQITLLETTPLSDLE